MSVCIDDHVIGGLPDGAARTRSDRDSQSRNSDPTAHGDSASGQHVNLYTVTIAVTVAIDITIVNFLTHDDANSVAH